MNKIISFEYIRAIATIGIIMCHCCYGIEGLGFLGKFLGVTFNTIFLIMSAFLIGLVWKRKNYPKYNLSFLKTRIGKLTFSYYPFIIVMFIFLMWKGYNITIKDLILQFTFLAWFDKIPGFGHLWFITMIVICYFAIYITSKFSNRIVKKLQTVSAGGALILLGLVSQIFLNHFGLPNRIIIYTLIYIYVFFNAETILKSIDKIPAKPLYICGSIVLFAIICLFYLGFRSNFTETIYCLISSTVVFAILKKIFNNTSSNSIITFISTISFEIYLVHHVFCFGEYSVYKIIHNPILGTIIIFAISFILAFILNKTSMFLKNMLSKQ